MRGLSDPVQPEPSPPAADPEGRLKLSAATEAFFRTDGRHQGPVLVVYHIQKTAGTALRHVVRANLPPAEVEMIPELRRLRHAPDELLRVYADWYGGLGGERRDRLCCVMSHLAGYLLPALDRPVETLVLVREPVDRTISYYHAKSRRRSPGKPFRTLEEIYAADPSGLDRPRDSWEQFFNWQSRCLLSVFHDVSELPTSAGPSARCRSLARPASRSGRPCLLRRRSGPLRRVRRLDCGPLRVAAPSSRRARSTRGAPPSPRSPPSCGRRSARTTGSMPSSTSSAGRRRTARAAGPS